MEMDNDRWHGSFSPPAPGTYLYAIEAWTDQFATWRKEFAIRRDAGQDLSLALREGLELVSQLKPKDRKARTLVDDYTREFAAEGNFELSFNDALAAAIARTDKHRTSFAVRPFLCWRNVSGRVPVPGTK